MAIQIALVFSPDCEKELLEIGFEKREVYIKSICGGTTQKQIDAGDNEFFRMTHKPYQFVTTSWWGAGLD